MAKHPNLQTKVEALRDSSARSHSCGVLVPLFGRILQWEIFSGTMSDGAPSPRLRVPLPLGDPPQAPASLSETFFWGGSGGFSPCVTPQAPLFPCVTPVRPPQNSPWGGGGQRVHPERVVRTKAGVSKAQRHGAGAYTRSTQAHIFTMGQTHLAGTPTVRMNYPEDWPCSTKPSPKSFRNRFARRHMTAAHWVV